MSSKFSVVTSELRSGSEELSQLNQSFKAAVNQLEALEGTLNGMWDGEANDTFHNAFISDKEQMMNFYEAIEKYVAVLREVSRRYSQAEANNVEIARNRTYR